MSDTLFDGAEQGMCLSCADFRVLDSETSLCKDCWREYRTEQEDDDDG